MSLPLLEWENSGKTVTVRDERHGRLLAPDGHIASITFGNKDSYWGEFMSRDEARALRMWLDLVLDE